MQTNIKKLELDQIEEIATMVWEVMDNADQLPNQAYILPEDVKRLLHTIIKKDMEGNCLTCYGIMDNKKLIAMIGYEQYQKKISYLYVLPEYQRQGLGSKLLDFIVENEADATKVLIRAHENAVAMYEKYGFEKNGDDSQYSIGMEYVLRRN